MAGMQPDDPYEKLARRALERHVRGLEMATAHGHRSPLAWQALLSAEIDRLPGESKAAVVTCYLENRSPREAAEMLGWSRRKVCTRLLLGRRRLLRRLERQGLALSARTLRRVLRAEARCGEPSDSAQLQAVLQAALQLSLPAPDGVGPRGWSSRLTELVRAALHSVDQWMAE